MRYSFPLLLVFLLPSAAHAILLQSPIACTMGTDCFIQNYVDHEEGPGWKDFHCGHLTYDGHKGTDFRLPSLAAMEAGINVLAVADGVVKNTRNDMPDINILDIGKESIAGKECGNGVMLEHEEGWSTQYCHMKKGSIAVSSGDEVHAGDVLGQVGLSGNTEFPHLHLTLRHGDEVIDPFTGKEMTAACGQSGFSTWDEEAQKTLAYNPPGLIAGGFATEAPDNRGVMAGKYAMDAVPADAPALLFWVQVYGPREGDVLHIELSKGGEHGEVVAEKDIPLTKSQAQYLQYIGIKAPAGRLESGTAYSGAFTLTRTTEKEGAQVLVKFEKTISVE